MALPATRFRASLYKVLDRVIATGVPVEVELRGRRVRIVPAESHSRLRNVVERSDYIVGDPEDLVQPTFDAAAWEKKWPARRRK
jgi:hypothetical protein